MGKRNWDPYTFNLGKRQINTPKRPRREQIDEKFLQIQNKDALLQQMSRPRYLAQGWKAQGWNAHES